MTYLSMYRGDDESFSVTVTDGGAVVDLTGCVLRFTAKRDVDDADEDAVIAKTSAIPGQLDIDDDPTTGIALINIDAEDTSDLTRGTVLAWDLQVTDTDDQVRTLDSGNLRIIVDVTRTAP